MPVTRIDRKPDAKTASDDAAQTRALIDALPWPCIVFDRDSGHLRGCNPGFREEFPHWGDGPDEAVFEQAFEYVGEQDGRRVYYASASRHSYRIERRELSLDGPVRVVFLINMSECIESLRRHREQHEQLLSTSRMMSVGEMATTLAHELNQPLGAAINYLAGCEQLAESAGNPRLLQGVRLAKRQSERAAQIIGSIREFVRSREPHRTNLACAPLVQGVIELLRLEAAQHQVAIETALPMDLPPIFADRIMIEQVLLNLIKNAIEAMRDTPPSQRRIVVSARVDYDDMIELKVVDRGCGIDESGLRQLFTPMYTTKPDGLGIGLAICRSIIEYHEGRLFAEPQADGQGGCALLFTVPRGTAA